MAAPVRQAPRRQHQYVAQVGIGLQAVGISVRRAGMIRRWCRSGWSSTKARVACDHERGGVRGEIEAGRAGPAAQSGAGVVGCASCAGCAAIVRGRWRWGCRSSDIPSIRSWSAFAVVQCSNSPALALPVMEPLRRHPAMLAVVAGTYASRRFVFVRELQTVYVAQARALGLDMQTPSVELFQYEIDPHPI